MNDGTTRRKQLLDILKSSKSAVSGSTLAKELNVSRQIIVQDIALLRAANYNILATTKGYILYQTSSPLCHRIFCVNHPASAIADELETIVDNGGQILDVIIEHDVYGQISANLMLENMEDIKDFCQKLEHSHSKPLSILADGIHYHTVEAASETILNNIEYALKRKGYLAS